MALTYGFDDPMYANAGDSLGRRWRALGANPTGSVVPAPAATNWNNGLDVPARQTGQAAFNTAVDALQGPSAQTQARAQGLRDFWERNGLPMQQGLVDQAMSDLNPDDAAIDAQTTDEAQQSTAVNRGMMDRQLQRMGLTQDSDAERKLGLAQALGQASAANSTRTNMIQRGTVEAQQLANFGNQEQQQALSGLQIGNAGLADYYSTNALADAAARNQQSQKTRGIVGGLSKIIKAFKDGGVVTSSPVALETGDVIIPTHVVRALGKDYFDRLMAEHGV
jgi:hypothetical protein